MLRCCLMTLVLLLGLGGGPSRAADAPTAGPRMTPALLAMSWDWDWDEFKKFWTKQLGKTTGILGTVSLVVGVGVLIVMSAKKKT